MIKEFKRSRKSNSIYWKGYIAGRFVKIRVSDHRNKDWNFWGLCEDCFDNLYFNAKNFTDVLHLKLYLEKDIKAIYKGLFVYEKFAENHADMKFPRKSKKRRLTFKYNQIEKRGFYSFTLNKFVKAP